MGVVSVTGPIFIFWSHDRIFKMGEDRHFKFGVLINTEEY